MKRKKSLKESGLKMCIRDRDTDGWIRKYHKNSNLVEELKAPVEEEKDWYTLKDKVREHLELYCTDENIGKVYGKYAQAHKRGDFSLRFRAQGFFWLPRTLLGIEGQMYAFYDMPEAVSYTHLRRQ